MAKHWSRMLALTLGLLCIGGWLALAQRGAAGKDTPKQPSPRRSVTGSDTYEIYHPVQVIDEQIAAQWEANQITPSRLASDFEFIRRAALDIMGRIATPEEVRAFINDRKADRRRRLIDKLVDSEEFARYWAHVWTTWLLTRSGSRTAHEQMQAWLEAQFAKKDCGFDKIVTELLTASGKNKDNGAVNYILENLGEPVPRGKQSEEGAFQVVPVTSRTTRLFLGVQVQCTQCHDHPYNKDLKQHVFWGINAFFRQVDRQPRDFMNRRDMMRNVDLTLVDDASLNEGGAVFFEKRNGVVDQVKATFLGDKRAPEDSAKSRRQELANFVVTSEYFGRAYVNRMWGHFLGRGFTNAVDDFGEHNPVTHELSKDSTLAKTLSELGYGDKPTLLDYLANEFKQYKYDPRLVVKWICNSEAYNLSVVANRTNDKADAEPFFSRMLLKVMSPEQLFESLMVATKAEANETKEAKKELRERWVKNLIANFGDDEGNEATFNGTVVQALMLMNGKELNDAVASPKGTVYRAMEKHKNTEDMIKELYLAALNRYPTQKERDTINKEIAYAKQGRIRGGGFTLYEDIFWALLNSNEFILNH